MKRMFYPPLLFRQNFLLDQGSCRRFIKIQDSPLLDTIKASRVYARCAGLPSRMKQCKLHCSRRPLTAAKIDQHKTSPCPCPCPCPCPLPGPDPCAPRPCSVPACPHGTSQPRRRQTGEYQVGSIMAKYQIRHEMTRMAAVPNHGWLFSSFSPSLPLYFIPPSSFLLPFFFSSFSLTLFLHRIPFGQ